MLPSNRQHFKRVAVWGGALAAAAAAASLIKFPPIVAASVLMGAALGLFNLYSVVRLVEALAGAASAGPGAGRASKVLTTLVHVFKLALVFAVLLFLVIYKLTDLFALLAGFTAVLLANLFAGLSGLNEGGGDAA